MKANTLVLLGAGVFLSFSTTAYSAQPIKPPATPCAEAIDACLGWLVPVANAMQEGKAPSESACSHASVPCQNMKKTCTDRFYGAQAIDIWTSYAKECPSATKEK